MKGDFTPGKIIPLKFCTHKADGTPITLTGTPVISVYKAGSTTESTAGVSLTVDYDSRTGLHSVVVDTSADGTFYAASNDFDLIITAGTVDGISVVGTKVGEFSLSNRAALRPTTADRTLDVSAGGEAGLDWANVGSPTTTQNLSGTTVGTAAAVTTVNGLAANVITAASIASDAITDAKVASDVTIASVTGAVGSVNGAVGSVAGNVGGNVVGTVASVVGAVGSVAGNVGGNVTGNVGGIATGGITTASFAAGAINAAAIAADAITDAKVASDVTIASVTGNVGGIAGTTTTLDALQTALNSAHGAGSWATATGFSTLTQAQVTGGAYALDSASFSFNAALDFTTTQKAATLARVTLADTLTTYTGNTLQTGDSFARIGLAGAGLTAIPWPAAWDAEVQSEVTDALNAALTESYRSAGATGSVAQMLYEIIAHLGESAIASTTKTLKKLDGSTTAKTYTLNSATTPTAITETT